MKLNEIKRLAEAYTSAELQAAAEAIENEEAPAVEVNGDDDGEKLTHVLGALDILEMVAREGCALPAAIRAYTQRVRNSIN